MISNVSDVAADAFEQQVRDCLAHYYDYAFLQDSELVRLLTPEVRSDAQRVQAFRELIEQAIDSLKPGPGSDADSRQARFYNILQYRYINQQQVQRVLYRLNLGERQFYRDHNKAIETLSKILLKQMKGSRSEPDTAISIQSEIQRLHSAARPEQVQVRTFLEKTLAAIQGLIARYEAVISLQVEDQRLVLANDAAVLRQTIIWLLSHLVIQAGSQSRFTITFAGGDQVGKFSMRCERAAQPVDLSCFEGHTTLHNLVKALEGEITDETLPDHSWQINLTVPLRKHSILVIDDNPDVIALFRRYLSGYPYLVLTAEEGDAALRIARTSAPGLIVLDVLLPRQDGWEILQNLKSHQQTQHIPVIVCSVLDSPELAHVLGADSFLRKPPGETEFRAALAQLVD